MRESFLWGVPFLLLALCAPAAVAQETGPGTPGFVDESTQALVDIAGSKSDKEAAQALIRLADRLMVSLEEKARAGKAKEANSVAEAYRVTMREGLANMGADKNLKTQKKVALKPGEKGAERAGEGMKDQTRAQDQTRTQDQTKTKDPMKTQEQLKTQDQTRTQDQKRTQERIQQQDRTQAESKPGADDVKGLVAAVTTRHAAALRNCMESASPEVKRALQQALESCMEVRSRFGFSEGPGPKAGEQGIPRGPGAGDGLQKGAPSDPPRGMIERPTPEPRRGP